MVFLIDAPLHASGRLPASTLAVPDCVNQELSNTLHSTSPATPPERRGKHIIPRHTRNTPRPEPRESYLKANLKSVFTTPEQNQAWIRVAQSTPPGGHIVFLDIENSVMKTLNDTLRDKNLVTSLTHRHKSIFLGKLAEIAQRHPGLRIATYSDFKSLRFAFDGAIPESLKAELAAAFERTNQEFAHELHELKLIRAQDQPESWFRGGTGDTADRANASARIAREDRQANRLLTYEKARSSLENARRQSEFLRRKLEARFQGTRLLEGMPGHRIPTRKVFDLIRKSKTPESLEHSIYVRLGVSGITVQDTRELLDYAKSVDIFSPALWVAKREIVNLDEATLGGFSADFLGLGSANQHAVASALAGAGDLDQALIAARSAERAVTLEFQNRLSAFRRIVGEGARCSGDDCIGVVPTLLSRLRKLRILQQLAANPETRGVRVTFVHAGVLDPGERTLLSTHGESIEKALREHLAGVIPESRLSELTFGIDMQTPFAHEGRISVLTGTIPGAPLTVAETREIQTALSAALKDVNRSLAREGIRSRYRPAPPSGTLR